MSSYAVQRILQITELQTAQSVPFSAAVRLCDYCVLFLLHDYACKYIWLTATWRNFDASWLSPPSCGWNSDKCFSLWYCWNTLCWRASDHTDIFINQRTECNLNNTINLRPLAPHIMPCYTHKGRSYRDHRFCDVTYPLYRPASISAPLDRYSTLMKYDTIRDASLTCARKPTWVSLIYRTETTTKKCETEKK